MINFSCALFVSCFVYCAANLDQLGIVSREKQDYDTINSSKNLETALYTDWPSHQRLQYEDFRVYGCQSKDSA